MTFLNEDKGLKTKILIINHPPISQFCIFAIVNKINVNKLDKKKSFQMNISILFISIYSKN